MGKFREVAAFAERPTPRRRLGAAIAAGSLAFLFTYLLLGVIWGAGSAATLFSAVALAVAAAFAAATLKQGLAITYGVLAAFWLLFDLIVLALGALAAGFG